MKSKALILCVQLFFLHVCAWRESTNLLTEQKATMKHQFEPGTVRAGRKVIC